MKVVLVHNSYQQTGGEDAVVEQERQLLKGAGHQVVVYRRSNHEIAKFSVLERLALIKRVVWAKDSRQELAKLLAQQKPQLVHVHNTFMMVSPSVYSVCQQAGVPVVQTLHNYRLLCPAATFFRDGHVCEECIRKAVPWPGVLHGCYHGSRSTTAVVALMLAVHHYRRTWTEQVDYYIAQSEFARGKFIGGGFPADRIAVKPNFVHPDPGVRHGQGEYALFVGRLSPEKGLATLLRAWARLGDRIVLRIVGDGPMRQELETQARRNRLNTAHFAGQVTQEQVLEFIKGARFLVFPSQWYESLPLTILQAFACGVPVISSGIGSMEEIIEDGRTGLVFRSGDADNLAEKVEWAWTHSDQLAEMGKDVRREYESKYTAERNYATMMEIYHRAIAGHARAPECLNNNKLPSVKICGME